MLKANSSTWVVLWPYSVQIEFTWDTTGLAAGPYRIGAWVGRYGSERPFDTHAQTTMWIGT